MSREILARSRILITTFRRRSSGASTRGTSTFLSLSSLYTFRPAAAAAPRCPVRDDSLCGKLPRNNISAEGRKFLEPAVKPQARETPFLGLYVNSLALFSTRPRTKGIYVFYDRGLPPLRLLFRDGGRFVGFGTDLFHRLSGNPLDAERPHIVFFDGIEDVLFRMRGRKNPEIVCWRLSSMITTLEGPDMAVQHPVLLEMGINMKAGGPFFSGMMFKTLFRSYSES